jgi:hypothetical protein
MTEEDEAFEELSRKQGDWGMQGSRKHQIMRYVEPLQRPWVGLTDEEFHDLQIENIDDPWANFKAIETKLKEKNT